jgi:predicted acyltransferase
MMSSQTEKIPASRPEPGIAPEGRLLSLDVYRGLTMFLLIAEYTLIYDHLISPEFQGTILASIGIQFHHHPWNGLRFWDLVQPFFMFIVGVALPFSTQKRLQRGDSQSQLTKHAVQRSLLLLLFGWMLYCIQPGNITFRFQNVLAQLSFTYLLAFLLMKRSFRVQFSVSIFLLVLTEFIYRTFPVSGFNQPFTPDHNFGAYVDMLISGELSGGHWVSFNALPTAAHTIWGVLAGKLLLSERSSGEKLKLLMISGVIGLIAGYALDPITPIIKRISTSSFVLASGGWSLLALAFSYWLIDLKKIQRWSRFLIIVGMNPLFIYLFAEAGGGKWLYSIVMPFSNGLMGWAGEAVAGLVTSVVVWFMLWYICYWLYKHKIFIKV